MKIRRGSPLHIVGVSTAFLFIVAGVFLGEIEKDTALSNFAPLCIFAGLGLALLFSVAQPERERAEAEVMASDPEAAALSSREKQSDRRAMPLMIAACGLLVLVVITVDQRYWVFGLIPVGLLFALAFFLQARSIRDRYQVAQKVNQRLEQSQDEDG